MADFRIVCGFFDHPKTKKLRRALGDAGVILLLRIWEYATQSRHTADKVYSDEEIELAVDWDGEDGEFVKILVACGWLDEIRDGYALHDWSEHNSYAANAKSRSDAARRAAKARWEEKRGVKTEPDMSKNADECEAQCPTHDSALPIDAKGNAPSPSPFPSPSPSPKKEENTYVAKPSPVKKKSKKTEYSPEYEEFFAAFPARGGRKQGKAEGQKSFDKAIRKKGVTAKFLIERIKLLGPTYGDYAPNPATWLNNERWQDEMPDSRASPPGWTGDEVTDANIATARKFFLERENVKMGAEK